jgi:hypothetical protein
MVGGGFCANLKLGVRYLSMECFVGTVPANLTSRFTQLINQHMCPLHTAAASQNNIAAVGGGIVGVSLLLLVIVMAASTIS